MTDADRVMLLIAGLAIDALFGDMPWLFRQIPHPVVLAGRAVAFFDRKLNRETRGEAVRRGRGIITVILLVGTAAALGLVVEVLCQGRLPGAVVEAALIGVLVAQRSLYEHVAAVANALDAGGLPAGRAAVSRIVGRDPMSLDSHGVAAGFAVELAVEERNGTAGEHDRVRDLPEEPRHVAEQSINGKPRNEQHHAIRVGHLRARAGPQLLAEG